LVSTTDLFISDLVAGIMAAISDVPDIIHPIIITLLTAAEDTMDTDIVPHQADTRVTEEETGQDMADLTDQVQADQETGAVIIYMLTIAPV
jgi:hypothetical protein